MADALQDLANRHPVRKLFRIYHHLTAAKMYRARRRLNYIRYRAAKGRWPRVAGINRFAIGKIDKSYEEGLANDCGRKQRCEGGNVIVLTVCAEGNAGQP
ncbi:hypothetical protein Poly41_48420 [Novipirellula artificiosorum]|uniref:Uncharacterized protein n=1 Tax=Novipirellula artificiosorum TaxID=2528016 RepID=A0A5C6D9P4_9BACT|nr:hypothetical protein Poly41_48420 [Novipirellula artificiosorum]